MLSQIKSNEKELNIVINRIYDMGLKNNYAVQDNNTGVYTLFICTTNKKYDEIMKGI